MIFKGKKFNLNKNIVMLPMYDENKKLMPYVEKEHYISFGRVTKLDEKKKNSVKTTYKYQGGEKDNQYVYAVPIQSEGYSLTNMMFGEKNKIFLFVDGLCYEHVNIKKNT